MRPQRASWIDRTEDANDRLLTVQEASETLRLSPRKLATMFATGALPRVKIGRATRVRLSDVQTLIQRGAA